MASDSNNDQQDIALASVLLNARSLLADAELLLKYERYSRALSLAILAGEEVGKFYLIKWKGGRGGDGRRHHLQKQMTTASIHAAVQFLDGLAEYHAERGLEIKRVEELSDAQRKWLDDPTTAQSREEVRNSTVRHMADLMAQATSFNFLRDVSSGDMQRKKNRGFYVDLSADLTVVSDPQKVVRAEVIEIIEAIQAALLYADVTSQAHKAR